MSVDIFSLAKIASFKMMRQQINDLKLIVLHSCETNARN